MITRRFKVTLVLLGWLLVLYGLLRLGFLWANRGFFADAPASEVAWAFVHGLRFDLAALLILNAPLLILWNLGLPRVPRPRFKAACFVLFALVNVGGVMLNVADYGYYPMVQRRLLHELVDRPQDLVGMVPQWFAEYPALCVGVLVAGAAFVALLGVLARRAERRARGPEGRVLPTLASGLLLAALTVLGIRGGLQQGILRTADAFKHSSNSAVGYLTLNSTYTVLLSALLEPVDVVRAMPDAEAEALTRDLLHDPVERPGAAGWPFLRTRTPTEPIRRRNVVVILMESWTWANVGPHEEGGRTVSRTPHFDALCGEGRLFTNFLASSQKSNEAIPSVVTSVPGVFRRPVIGSRQELTRFRGLGSILKEHGWSTSFHYGAEKTIMGFDSFARLAGFDVYRSEEDFAGRERGTRDGVWGVYDHLFFADTLGWLDGVPSPFLTLMFSLSPHDPYVIPPDVAADYVAFAHETPYQRCLRYSDWALGRFVEQAKKRAWFADSVFVVTADHTRFAPPNSYYESFHVPLLLLAPGLIEPGRDDRIGFQPDILPTLLDLLRVPTTHASMGRTLLGPRAGAFAVTQRDEGFALFDDRWALLHDLERDVKLFAYRDDARFVHDLSAEEPVRTAELERRLLGYLQSVSTAVAENRIWPAESAPR